MKEERQGIAHPAVADDDDDSGGKNDNNDVAPAAGDTVSSSSSSSTAVPAAERKASVTATSANRFEKDNMRAKFDHSSRKVVVHNVLKFMKSKDVSKLTTSWINEYNNNNNNNRSSYINIQITNARKPPKDSWIKVTLADESMVNPFIAFINSGGKDGKALVNERGRPLFAKRVDDMMIEYDHNHVDGKSKEEDGSTNTDSCPKKRKESFQTNDTNANDDIEKGNISNNDNDKDPIRKRFKADSPQTMLSDDEVRDAITPLWRLSYEEQLTSKIRDMVNKCANKIVKEIKGKFR